MHKSIYLLIFNVLPFHCILHSCLKDLPKPKIILIYIFSIAIPSFEVPDSYCHYQISKLYHIFHLHKGYY